jgi:uncharacterized delta-60 repeat protein
VADRGNAVALQPGTGGKILVVGSSGRSLAAARYNANGTLDNTFGNGGKVITDVLPPVKGSKGGDNYGNFADAIAVQPDGKIVLAGLADTNDPGITDYFALVRYNANGTLDTTFGSGGKVITSIHATRYLSHTDIHTVAVALQADGEIVLAGGTDPHFQPGGDFVVARFNPNGTPDAAFGSGGQVLTDFAGGEDRVSGIAIQTDGKIVAVGNTTLGTSQWLAAARYNPDGSPDAGFGQGGTVTTPVGTSVGTEGNDVAIAYDLHLQPLRLRAISRDPGSRAVNPSTLAWNIVKLRCNDDFPPWFRLLHEDVPGITIQACAYCFFGRTAITVVVRWLCSPAFPPP